MSKEKKQTIKRQQRTEGAFVKVPFDPPFHTYARILPEASFAFYDFRTKEEVKDLKKIASAPILFIVAVYKDAITKGRWVKIGKLPLEADLQKLPPKFIWDPIGSRFNIYENGKIRPSIREECRGLERASVWEPEHIEERLRDHYSGRSNRYVERDKKVFS